MNMLCRFWAAALLLSPLAAAHADEGILGPEKLQASVARFNAGDNELYPQHVPNMKAAEFLEGNVPRFECPDADIEAPIPSAGGRIGNTSRRPPTNSSSPSSSRPSAGPRNTTR